MSFTVEFRVPDSGSTFRARVRDGVVDVTIWGEKHTFTRDEARALRMALTYAENELREASK